MEKLHERRLIKFVELYNSGMTVQSDLQKELGISIATINAYINEARKLGLINAKKHKIDTLVEMYKSGVTDLNELSEKLQIEIPTIRSYISVARKQGLLEKKSKKRTVINKVADLYNSGVDDNEEISKILGVGKRTASTYTSRARKNDLIERKDYKAKRMNEIVNLYNSGIKEAEKIAVELGLVESTVKNYLKLASRQGLITLQKTKLERFVELYNSGEKNLREIESILGIKNYSIYMYLSRAKEKGLIPINEEAEEEKALKLKIIEGLKVKYPREVAKSLGISYKKIYDIMDEFNISDKKKIKKSQLESNPLYDKVKTLINEKNMDTMQALHFLYDTITDPKERINLSKMYYVAENLDVSERILKEVVDDENLDINVRKKAYQENEKIHLENVSKKIRGHYKSKDNNQISYDELCKRYYVKTDFIVDVLGEENRDYGE